MSTPDITPPIQADDSKPLLPAADDTMPHPGPESRRSRVVILAGVVVVVLIVATLFVTARARTNHVALSDAPKPVSVVTVDTTTFRPRRSYVGATASWNQANVGPQFISAYTATVLVRPGAIVRRGEVLATLDCRNASAASKEIAARAKSIADRQVAVEHETARMTEMKKGGFASDNEVEELGARASSQAAEVESLKANLASRTLEVDDCILRAPFAGEIAERFVDPGAFVRPGSPVVTVVDRTTVRVVADAPESDFTVVTPGTPVAIQIAAIGQKLTAKVSRQSPSADEMTRTVHFEIDLPNPGRALPVGATARVVIEVGTPQPAASLPMRAATVRGDKATVFAVTDGKAHRKVVPVLGEQGGSLFVEAGLAGAVVVIEGRALLDDGDAVAAKALQ